jgi:mycoredoxin
MESHSTRLAPLVQENNEEHEETMQEIIMYTTNWCPYCRIAKAAFDRNGIAYREVNIEEHPELAASVEEWNGGYRTVPTFKVGDEIVTYKDRARLHDLLGVRF